VPLAAKKCVGSAADPGCLSQIRDPHCFPSQFSNPTTTKQSRGKIAINFTKQKIILFFNRYRKKFELIGKE
jgi:hypothetical protein